MAEIKDKYPATFDIEYPNKLDRLSSFFRIIWSIPAVILLSILSVSGGEEYVNEAGKEVSASGGGIMAGLFVATALMIFFRQRYPRWWF
ncbi:MAG: DUF4389 domain-containing protein, partial [bacterium]|nr:DUF4389 domain-containing protein [bacterium]